MIADKVLVVLDEQRQLFLGADLVKLLLEKAVAELHFTALIAVESVKLCADVQQAFSAAAAAVSRYYAVFFLLGQLGSSSRYQRMEQGHGALSAEVGIRRKCSDGDCTV